MVEFRTYSIAPQHYPAFLDLTNRKIERRMQHSKLLGYFTSELGGINQVCHFWEYDSLAQRQRVRTALTEDSEWMQGYMKEMRPMLEKQDNVLLSPTLGSFPVSPIVETGEGSVYVLRTIDYEDVRPNEEDILEQIE